MKIFTETLGCPKNFNDTEVAEGILERAGHEITDDFAAADVIIVNTCGFINDAKVESIDRIFEFANAKSDDCILIVSGCLSERYIEDLYEEMPEVDIFIGVNDYEDLPAILTEYADSEGSRMERRLKRKSRTLTDFSECTFRKFEENPYTATIKISEGCNNICAYCVIPKIRGPFRSRPMEDIVSEAEKLANLGCRELVLIAQDVTAYGMDLYGELALYRLLRKLCRVEGIRWIRLMYCYEDRITDELIDTIAEEDKICNYLDIPIQHCSDSVLSSMNRRSTKKSITDTIKKLREKVPDIHIRTTLITGFPGETEEDFEELYKFVSEMKFERLGVFSYSREEGTAAAAMDNQVDDDIKDERKDEIMRLQIDISLESNQREIGRRMEVMVEGRDEDGSYYGRTRYDAPEIDNSVIFTSRKDHKPGDIVDVMIEDAFDYDLTGMEV